MGTINKVNNIALSSISKQNNVSKDDISKIDNESVPAAATHSDLWVLVGQDNRIGTSTDGSSWTIYQEGHGNNLDNWAIAYGHDSGGDDLWVIAKLNNTREINYSSTPATTDSWTHINWPDSTSIAPRGIGHDKESGTWIAASKSKSNWKNLMTADADATSWVPIDYTAATTNYSVNYSAASNGSGSWMVGIDDDLIFSSDNGANWSLVGINFLGAGNDIFNGIAHGGGVWIVVGGNGKGERSIDGGLNWTTLTMNAGIKTLINIAYDGGANGTGTWIAVGNTATMVRSTDNGATWSAIDHSATHTRKLSGIASNGSGSWVAVGDEGRIGTSTDDGATWSWSSEISGADLKAVAINWRLPLIGG